MDQGEKQIKFRHAVSLRHSSPWTFYSPGLNSLVFWPRLCNFDLVQNSIKYPEDQASTPGTAEKPGYRKPGKSKKDRPGKERQMVTAQAGRKKSLITPGPLCQRNYMPTQLGESAQLSSGVEYLQGHTRACSTLPHLPEFIILSHLELIGQD
jgi:hypothetical protein